MIRVIRPYDFLLDGETGWRERELRGAAITDGAIALQSSGAEIPLDEAHGAFGGLTLPRGVAIWRDEIFIADTARDQILHWRACRGPSRPLATVSGEASGARRIDSPAGLAINHRDDLVVVDAGNSRLVLFTLPGLALRSVIGPFKSRAPAQDETPADSEPPANPCALPDDLPDAPPRWRPVDAACGRNGVLYVADAEGFVWRLDAQGRPAKNYDGRLPEGHAPRRILADANDRVFVLAAVADETVVLLLNKYGKLALAAGEVDAALAEASLPPSRLSLRGDRILLAPAGRHVCKRAPLLTDVFVDAAGFLDLEGSSSPPFLFPRPRTAIFENNGLFLVEPLDSGKAENPWHRLLLEATIPERTGVRIFSFTSDVLRPDLDAKPLLQEPPRLGTWRAAPDNVDEWLIQSPPGRFLYLAFVLKGPGDRTPMIERAYVYKPRRSSLRFLPAAFHEDETGRDVLDRMLSLYDTIFDELESEIEDFALRLDAEGTPADFLPWLASWFDLTLHQQWSEAQKRNFLENVITLYRWRGTIRGMELLLRLHLDAQGPLPRVVEHFRGLAQPALSHWLGNPPEGDLVNHFTALLPAYAVDSDEKRHVVRRLIDANKPAHSHYTLRAVSPGVRLGGETMCGSAMGLDSVLGNHQPWRLPDEEERENAGILGGRTMLADEKQPPLTAVHLGRTKL